LIQFISKEYSFQYKTVLIKWQVFLWVLTVCYAFYIRVRFFIERL
jgi:hypothetical protein